MKFFLAQNPTLRKEREGWGTPFSQWHGLPWRPRQRPSTQQVKVDVKDRLTCAGAYVVDRAIAGLDAFLARKLGCD